MESPTIPFEQGPPHAAMPPPSPTVASMTSSEPPKSKRWHAIDEVLTTERAYASDMALVQNVYIPLAIGEEIVLGTKRYCSRLADGTPPMSIDDARTIFSNIGELAELTDDFLVHIEDAVERDTIGELFLRTIPDMEHPYKYYISRHDTASRVLQALPPTELLTAYIQLTRKLANDISHAWDLHSLLIKPVQRLLKYPLLLTAILDATPDGHPDKENLKMAREAMLQVAQRVNEERRRTEVVKDVLKRTNKDLLVRIKSISTRKRAPPPDSDESIKVAQFHTQLLRTQAFTNQLTQNLMEYSHCASACTNTLHNFARSFSRVIGLDENPSEAFNAFLDLIDEKLAPLDVDLNSSITLELLTPLSHLLNTFTNPLRLLDMLNNTLLPLHTHLIHMPLSQKNRPPSDLVKASAEYLALRAKLAEELPTYLKLAESVLSGCILRFGRVQSSYYESTMGAWNELWQALVLEGEGDDLSAGETLQVWWDRWEEVGEVLDRLRITQQLPKRLTSTRRSSSMNSVPRVSSPLPLSSNASMRSRTTKSSVECEFDTASIGYDYASMTTSPIIMEPVSPLSTYHSMPIPITPQASLKIRTRPGTPTPSIKSTKRTLAPKYVVYAVYPFEPPYTEYTYDGYPFLEVPGQHEMYEVLKECGHPRLHEARGLRLVINDDDPDADDCLLLARRGVGGGYKAETGWILASFVKPVP